MATPEQIAAYDELHGRARKDALTRPPFLWMDMCGYEYALHHAGQHFQCRDCRQDVVGQDGVTLHARIAYTDLHRPLGRAEAPLGMMCSTDCADSAFDKFVAEHRLHA